MSISLDTLAIAKKQNSAIGYSTTPQENGKKWIDGRKVKVVTYPINITETSTTISLSSIGIPNDSYIISTNFVGNGYNSYYYSSSDFLRYYYSGNNIVITCGYSYPERPIATNLLIEYV